MIIETLHIASMFTATIYGVGSGEVMCGDVEHPRPCAIGAIMANGEIFDPSQPTVAVWLPANRKMPQNLQVCFLDSYGLPQWFRVTDKKGASGGYDLTPSAVSKLGLKPSKHWSGRLEVCGVRN